MSSFEIGQEVELKSGGPKMTVADTGDYRPQGPENGVKCIWFPDGKGASAPLEHVFDAATLKLYKPKSGTIPLTRS